MSVTDQWLPDKPFHESLPLSSFLEKYSNFWSFASQATGLQYWNTIQPQWNQKAFLDEKILIDKHQYWWFSTLSLRRTVCHPKTTTWVNLTLALKFKLKDDQLRNLKSNTNPGSDAMALASGERHRLPKYRHISHDQLKLALWSQFLLKSRCEMCVSLYNTERPLPVCG